MRSTVVEKQVSCKKCSVSDVQVSLKLCCWDALFRLVVKFKNIYSKNSTSESHCGDYGCCVLSSKPCSCSSTSSRVAHNHESWNVLLYEIFAYWQNPLLPFLPVLPSFIVINPLIYNSLSHGMFAHAQMFWLQTLPVLSKSNLDIHSSSQLQALSPKVSI